MMFTTAAPSSSSAAPPCFHSLPIQTDFEGTTDVHANFTGVMTRDAKAALWHAHLRGRHLVGAEVTLPEDYAVALVDVRDTTARTSPSAAYHIEREKEMATEMDVETFVQVAASSFVQWEHDQPPAAAATLPQWIALAAVLHSTEPPAS